MLEGNVGCLQISSFLSLGLAKPKLEGAAALLSDTKVSSSIWEGTEGAIHAPHSIWFAPRRARNWRQPGKLGRSSRCSGRRRSALPRAAGIGGPAFALTSCLGSLSRVPGCASTPRALVRALAPYAVAQANRRTR